MSQRMRSLKQNHPALLEDSLPLSWKGTEEWVKKMWYIYTMEYYSAIKKNEITPFSATWMDLESVILSQTEKEKYHMTSLICGI